MLHEEIAKIRNALELLNDFESSTGKRLNIAWRPVYYPSPVLIHGIPLGEDDNKYINKTQGKWIISTMGDEEPQRKILARLVYSDRVDLEFQGDWESLPFNELRQAIENQTTNNKQLLRKPEKPDKDACPDKWFAWLYEMKAAGYDIDIADLASEVGLSKSRIYSLHSEYKAEHGIDSARK